MCCCVLPVCCCVWLAFAACVCSLLQPRLGWRWWLAVCGGCCWLGWRLAVEAAGKAAGGVEWWQAGWGGVGCGFCVLAGALLASGRW